MPFIVLVSFLLNFLAADKQVILWSTSDFSVVLKIVAHAEVFSC